MSQLHPADPLDTPAPSFAGLNQESGLNTPHTPPQEDTLLAPETHDPDTYPNEKNALGKDGANRGRRLKWILVVGGVVLIVVVLAVVLPVYFTVIKPKNNRSSSPPTGNNNGNSTDPGDQQPDEQADGKTTGGDGSIVFTKDGNFTYKNPFGGFWVYDPKDPFNNGAKAQSWTPALNETWTWGKDMVRGVNLGGWLVLEPFISPALFEKYLTAPVPPVDEYSLMQAMRADGSIGDLEKHYQTFITEQDFAEIAGAGLNWVRIPVGFWAVQTFDDEPYLESVSWKYLVQAFQWARKYGLRVNLDLHAHPGSQNGWNHSGYGRGVDGINWLKGIMGIANAQRSLDYIRVITEFISQPQYSPVVPMFGIVNEPRVAALDRSNVETFNYQAYKIIRGITGVGEGKGPIISIHDGFADFDTWFGFLVGADRLAMDTHPYFAFDGPNPDPVAAYVARPCPRWGSRINQTQEQFGILTAGEFSAAINDCGLFINGVPNPHSYAGDCAQWDNWQSWDQATKDNLKTFVLSSMDALQNYFFWTWKIGESLQTGTVQAPFWAYKLGLDNGWIPEDPRTAVGTCQSLGEAMDVPFNGAFQPWQTGGNPAAQPTATEAYVWPPLALGDIVPASWLPTYTPTAPITTLPGPVVTNAVDGGDGWFDDNDTTPMMAPEAGCNYPDAYSAATIPAPTGPVCGPGAVPLPTGAVLATNQPVIPVDTLTSTPGIPTSNPLATETAPPVRRF